MSGQGETKGGSHGYNLMTSLVLILPLFLVYQLGVLLTWPIHNGADLITSLLVEKLDLVGYIALNVAMAALICVLAASKRKEQGVEFKQMVPLLLESAFYAFFLGSVIFFFMIRILHLEPPRMSMDNASFLDRFVMSAGAGVHEELLFRLVLLNGLALGLKGLKFGPKEAFLAALLVSSALFSAVHHLGSMGDPFTVWVFTFRLLAGAIFGVIYWFRGLAVAVYTHALYDMYVMIILRN
ncbi:MAG: CPBP family intramembrane metalloprotease [Planctomycetes bacterium]|nr:CPBP family intramembrane metalloprotease [Planctomycetota bacterium]